MTMTTTLATAAVMVLGTTGLVAWNSFNANVWHQPSPAVASFYDLKAQTLEGETFAFEDLKGKRVLLVNTASRCGYTRQYAPLEELHKRYQGDGLVVLGFPATSLACKNLDV